MLVYRTEEWERFVRRVDRRLWLVGRAAGTFARCAASVAPVPVEAGDVAVWFTKCLVRDRDGRVLRRDLVESFRAFSGRVVSGRRLIPLFRALAGNPEPLTLGGGNNRGFRGWRLAS